MLISFACWVILHTFMSSTDFENSTISILVLDGGKRASPISFKQITCADLEGGQGVRGPDPPENHKKFLAILFLILYKITKPASQNSILSHHRHARKTPFKWGFTGWTVMAHLYWHLDPLSRHEHKKNVEVIHL